VAFHPTKTADEEKLIPYGGGATYNEIDGNLTLWQEQGQIKFHQNRVRGPAFDPCFFKIEKLACPDILDDQGRQILLPVMRRITNEDAEQHAHAEANFDLALLKAIAENPDVQALRKLKLVEPTITGDWRLTPKAQREITNPV
jgi:hypothetical protein